MTSATYYVCAAGGFSYGPFYELLEAEDFLRFNTEDAWIETEYGTRAERM